MSRLSTRSDAKDLPPFDPNAERKPVEVLQGEASCDTWRIIEAFSSPGLPFDLELSWSAGSGAGAGAMITVPWATRISVFARSLRILATNLSDRTNRVGVTVADGFAMTRNQWEHRAKHASDDVISPIPVPPFASTVRVDLADTSLLAPARVEVLDGLGRISATYDIGEQPLAGIPVGGASKLQLELAADTDYRAVFFLSL